MSHPHLGLRLQDWPTLFHPGRATYTHNQRLACPQLPSSLPCLHLRQASTLDPSRPDDLELFWGASYCLRLPAAQGERLAEAICTLLSRPDVLREQAGDAATAEVLESVLRGWVEPGAARSVAEVEAERRRLVLARLSVKVGHTVSTDAELRSLQKGLADAVLHNLLPWPRRDGRQGGDDRPNQASGWGSEGAGVVCGQTNACGRCCL